MASWGDILLTAAQVAVTLAGFMGLIGLFVARGRAGLTAPEIMRFRVMLDYSLIGLLAALFPFLPAALEFFEASVWRISSVGMLFVLAVYYSLFRPKASSWSQVREHLGWFIVIVVGEVTRAALLLDNASGLLHTPAFFPYLFSVYWNLVGAAIGFGGIMELAWSSTEE